MYIKSVVKLESVKTMRHSEHPQHSSYNKTHYHYKSFSLYLSPDSASLLLDNHSNPRNQTQNAIITHYINLVSLHHCFTPTLAQFPAFTILPGFPFFFQHLSL